MISRWAGIVGGAWAKFWFTPGSASTFASMRVMLGLSSLGWVVSVLPDVRAFYFDDGLLAEPRYASNRLGLFQWATGDSSVILVVGAMAIAAIALIVGRGVRVAAPVLWIAMLTMQQGAPSALNAGDLLLRVWTAYFALYAILTPSRFLDVGLFGRRDATGTRTWPLAPGWLTRIVQIQLTVIYPAGVIQKLDGDTWREGTAALYALGLQDFERFWVPDFVRENLVVGNLMTWFTLGVELSLAFLLWTRRTRWLGIVLGLSMHLGFDYVMRLGFFLPALLVGYLSFVKPDELERALRWLSSARPGRDRDRAMPVEAPPGVLVNS